MITFINFVAGIIIGVVQRGMSFPNALKAYTTLTIGDGLVSQIPALIISLSAGLLVSKSGAVGSTDQIIFSQFGKHPRAMWLCSGLSAGIALVPGLPAIPFILIAAATAMIASTMKKAADAAAQGTQATAGSPAGTKSEQQTAGAASAAAPEEDIASTLHIDSIKLELSYLLLPLIHYQKGNRLTEQIKALRKQMARDLGFIIPSVRIQDVIKIKDIECARGEVKPNMLLVMDAKGGEITIPGEDTKEPAFGLAAKWITDNYREEALFRNYTVVDPPTVITTHLTEVVKENITELLSYSETQKLLDSIEESHKKLVTDTIGGQISVSGIQRVLQNLLSEGVSIRDLPTIIEAIAEAGRVSGTTLTQITEHVRTRLSRQISHANTTADNYIPITTLSPQWEQTFTESLVGTGSDKQLSMSPSKLQEFIYAVKRTFDEQIIHGHLPVLLVSPTIRPYVRSVIERFRPITVIMSQNEVHPKAKLKTLGQIV
jgi:flagellar biosynthesis protein FlhA